MRLMTFTGRTPNEALKKAQLECGENLSLVNTKEIRTKTNDTPTLYELVVTFDDSKNNATEQAVFSSSKNGIRIGDVDELSEPILPERTTEHCRQKTCVRSWTMGIFDFIRGILQEGNDKAVNSAAEKFINKKLEKYGVVRDVKVGKKHKILLFELQLDGESRPIGVVSKYSFSKEENQVFVNIDEIETSKPWLNVLLNTKNEPLERIEIPAEYLPYVELA